MAIGKGAARNFLLPFWKFYAILCASLASGEAMSILSSSAARAARILLAFCLILLPLRAGMADTVTIRDFNELSAFIEKNGYSLQKWRTQQQPVPPYVILDIPDEWRLRVAPNLPVDEKKRTFLLLTVPLALVANHALLQDRRKLLELENETKEGRRMSPEDKNWLAGEGTRYGVSASLDTEEFWRELTHKMDLVPPSLMLAQMIEESGWGTSRFTSEGNAFFGQWSYKSGIKPGEQRAAEKGDYRIAAFKAPLDSVGAYLLNLNSNQAYAEFRAKRAHLRAAEKVPTGYDLVDTLINYSERKETYVHLLRDIIARNDLAPFDHAELADERIKYLVLR